MGFKFEVAFLASTLTSGAERPFIRTDYPLKGDLSIPAPKPLPFEYFLTVLAWCETFDVDEG